MDRLIFSTKNFTVVAPHKPHITRCDGGHIAIVPIVAVPDRTALSPLLAIELMRLTMVLGAAMERVMNHRGVDVGRVNYQENGNWRPSLHVHVYGRARSAKLQRWGEALYFPKPETGYYDGNEPLNAEDARELAAEITALFQTDKYQDAQWGIPPQS